MVKIRLARGGAKKKPFYSIVATDSKKRRDSGHIERLGYFNPVARGQEIRLSIAEDKLQYWTSKGAQISTRVKQLVKEFKDPSIREKVLAKQAAAALAKEKALANEAMRQAQAEAKAQAKEKAEAKTKVAAETTKTATEEASKKTPSTETAEETTKKATEEATVEVATESVEKSAKKSKPAE